jgi:hypothetical protein
VGAAGNCLRTGLRRPIRVLWELSSDRASQARGCCGELSSDRASQAHTSAVGTVFGQDFTGSWVLQGTVFGQGFTGSWVLRGTVFGQGFAGPYGREVVRPRSCGREPCCLQQELNTIKPNQSLSDLSSGFRPSKTNENSLITTLPFSPTSSSGLA